MVLKILVKSNMKFHMHMLIFQLLQMINNIIFYFYLLRAECREQNPIYDHL